MSQSKSADRKFYSRVIVKLSGGDLCSTSHWHGKGLPYTDTASNAIAVLLRSVRPGVGRVTGWRWTGDSVGF